MRTLAAFVRAVDAYVPMGDSADHERRCQPERYRLCFDVFSSRAISGECDHNTSVTLLDLAYITLAAVTSPFWVRKKRSDWGERFGKVQQIDALPDAPRLLIHAVSLGEVNATKPLVQRLLETAPDLHIILTATTDTGIARAHTLYDLDKATGRLHVRRYPLDFSWSVQRFLSRISPDGALLMELEVWPQFIKACKSRGIPVGVVNGRLSARSFKNYARLRFALRTMFRRLSFAATQTDAYTERFEHMQCPGVHTVGSMKWDSALDSLSATQTDLNSLVNDLRSDMGIDPDRPLIVAGSTAPGEPKLILRAIENHPSMPALLVAPRRPEWFDLAAEDLGEHVVRRSKPSSGDPEHGRYVLDTFGELRAAYALAKIVIIGRSFVDLHGSDPMEAAALAKPIIIGPNVDDFEQPVEALSSAGGLRQTDTAGLAAEIDELLTNHDLRHQRAQAASDTVQANAGAADRTLQLIREHMPFLFECIEPRNAKPSP